MSVDTWDEIRTAYHVARLGTVSGAAEALGVHHATVIRHVDALEARLGAKLFQRHARGYTPTEAGHDLLKVAAQTEDQFTQLVGRIRGRGSEVSGEIIVTSLPGLPRLVPLLTEFMEKYPDIRVRFLTDERVFRMEYGEAHLAIRAGLKPDQPDNIVQPFCLETASLYASRAYVDAHEALPEGFATAESRLPVEALGDHRFIGPGDPDHRAPFYRWMNRVIPEDRLVFRTSEDQAVLHAIAAGVGIGFLGDSSAERVPDLVRMVPSRDEWTVQLWLVTHVDLHRTAKVQALVSFLKASIVRQAQAQA